MAFTKAQQLLDLATYVRSKKMGVTILDVRERFQCSKRTAQRLLGSIEFRYGATSAFGEDRRKRWYLAKEMTGELANLTPDELAALDIAIETLGPVVGASVYHLKRLREKILAVVPSTVVTRIEPDQEAIIEGYGVIARPRPQRLIGRFVSDEIEIALKASVLIHVVYEESYEERWTEHMLAPYGLLMGDRRYLVAHPGDKTTSEMRLFAADRIERAKASDKAFVRDSSFRLRDYASRAFGPHNNENDYGEVVWKFSPKVASYAYKIKFHPSQRMRHEKDGSLIVRFAASGHLEMAWYLYAWGDQVEVLEPKSLRDFVHPYRRADFTSLP